MEVALPRLDQIPTVKVPLHSLNPADSPRRLGENMVHARRLALSDDPLPPILVHRVTMRVIDGMHRMRAAELRGEKEIDVRFVDGDEASSFVLAVSENVRHGLPLSAAERKAAVARIIDCYPEWSDRMIASVSGLSATMVAITRKGMARNSKPRAHAYTIGRDGRIRPRDSAQRREFARQLLLENPDSSLREIGRLAGISAETARSVRSRLQSEGELGQAQRGDGKAAGLAGQRRLPTMPPTIKSLAPPGHGLATADAMPILALRADPAFRSTDNGRSLLRMLAACQIIEKYGEQFLASMPTHCVDRVALAARECARTWEAFAERLERLSCVPSRVEQGSAAPSRH